MTEKHYKDAIEYGGHRLTADEWVETCHASSVDAGWWDELKEVQSHLPPELHAKVATWFLATKLCLIHSEVSEMMEGLRKGSMDDHLPHLPMEGVEGADVFIRLCDYMGQRGYSLSHFAQAKMVYNWHREDHKPENREAEGGKSF